MSNDAFDHVARKIDKELSRIGVIPTAWRATYGPDVIDILQDDGEQAAIDYVVGRANAFPRVLEPTTLKKKRSASENTFYTSKPTDWSDRSAQTLEDQFGVNAAAIRKQLISSEDPIPPEQAAELISGYRDSDTAIGDTLELVVPEWFDHGDGLGHFITRDGFRVHRGYELDPDDEDPDPLPPGFNLARWASIMVDHTGCELVEAIGFILCDVTFDLPWIKIQRTPMRGENAFGLVRYEIVVGTPEVPAEDLRRAYSAFRKASDPEFHNKRPRRRQGKEVKSNE